MTFEISENGDSVCTNCSSVSLPLMNCLVLNFFLITVFVVCVCSFTFCSVRIYFTATCHCCLCLLAAYAWQEPGDVFTIIPLKK